MREQAEASDAQEHDTGPALRTPPTTAASRLATQTWQERTPATTEDADEAQPLSQQEGEGGGGSRGYAQSVRDEDGEEEEHSEEEEGDGEEEEDEETTEQEEEDQVIEGRGAAMRIAIMVRNLCPTPFILHRVELILTRGQCSGPPQRELAQLPSRARK